MERNSITFYKSVYDAIKILPKDIQSEIWPALMEYGFYGAMPDELKPVALSIFTLVKPLMDANNARYENGRKGGAKGYQTVTKGEPKLNQTVTKGEPNIDIDIENIDNKESSPNGEPKKAGLSSPPCQDKVDYGKLEEYYNSCAVKAGIPRINSLTDARKAAIRARVAQYGKKGIEDVMEKVMASDFLRGRNDRDWQAGFDWIFKQQNFTRILEGVYDKKAKPPGENGGVNDYWRDF